ncbi:MAG: hypothetical protein ACQETH_09215 [Candidatus Rifleibacteriota bacterium]
MLNINKTGMVLPLIALAALSMGLFIASLTSMGQSSRARITHLNKSQACYYIAQSAYQKLIARIHKEGWYNRCFKSGPHREINQNLLDGSYDLHVENTPGPNKDFQMDIYIRSRFVEHSRLYFWRVMYRSDLLDISNRNWVVEYASLPEENFPAAAETGEFASKIDKLIKERKANESATDDLSAKIIPATTINDVLDIIGNPDPKATNTDEFEKTVKLPSSIKGIPPTPFPVAQPEPGPEEPVPAPIPDNSASTEQPLDPSNDPATNTTADDTPFQGWADKPSDLGANLDPGGLTDGQAYDPGPQISSAETYYNNSSDIAESAEMLYTLTRKEAGLYMPSDDLIRDGLIKALELVKTINANVSKMDELLAKAKELAENVSVTQSSGTRNQLESIVKEISTLNTENESLYQQLKTLCTAIVGQSQQYSDFGNGF